jgi:hypothetical protein
VFDAEGKYLCRISLRVMLPITLTMSGAPSKSYSYRRLLTGSPKAVLRVW